MKKHEKKHMPDTTEYGPPLFDVDRFRIRFYTALLVLVLVSMALWWVVSDA